MLDLFMWEKLRSDTFWTDHVFAYVKFPLVDAFSLPPIPHFIINESQVGVIE